MVNTQRFLSAFFVICCALVSSISWAASFTASVDRKNISENDTFSLVLRYSEQVGFGSPDLTPLEKDFRILNQQRSSQFRSVNGRTESFTEWTLIVSPKRTGKLVIPAISFDSSRTQPISINVQPLSAAVKKQLEKEFFFDIKISEGPYYVQGQILYTEKLFYSVNHEDPSLSDFKVTDARLQQLGDVRRYQTVVDGQRLGVYERQFAIFPEQSGELVIPGQRFNARVTNPYDRWSRGRQAGIVSKPIRVNISAIPASYPQAPWLPSKRIKISEQFSNGDDSSWMVGEAITRTITIEAQGLSGSQIPAIALPVVDKIRYYPDKSENNEQLTETGLIGSLQQSMAIVPTAAGRLVLPEVRIPWWNVRTGTVEYAVLPARTIQVEEAEITPIDAPATTAAAGSAELTLATTNAQGPGYWILASAFLLLTNFLLAFLLWKAKTEPTTVIEKGPLLKDEKQCWKQLKQACQKNEAAAIRQALIDWAALRYPQQNIQRLEQIQQLTGEPRLAAALAELDALLYAPANSNTAFNGSNLLALLKQLPQENSNNKITGLKPLYS